MNIKLSKGQQGFTLLEIMIAMVICAVVFSIIYSAYSGTFRNRDVLETQEDIYMAARIALERIVEDLESAYLLAGAKGAGSDGDQEGFASFVGEEGELDGRRADALMFLSRAHVLFSGEERPLGIARIRYHVKKQGDGDGLYLYRSERLPVEGEEIEGEDEGFLLCEGLNSVRFSYYDSVGDEYQSWDSRGEEQGNKLPAKVSITLEFLDPLDPEVPVRFFTSISLPLGLEESNGERS
ncbi:MAG: prepilin-type N-terminal cleavage/methylation domain-containing protein [Deltaproteobacteria bacterium]|nr:prepilin-type N-terminal cleavage/methylation domain-containing protein [Deltaproteobacteria bacterium]